MKIFFAASNNLYGKAIRLFEGGEYNHTGFVMPNGQLMQSLLNTGVHVSSSVHAYAETVPKFVLYDLIVPNEQAGLNFLNEQIGKGYDITAILGFLAWRDWSTDDKWYCSELLAKWMQVVGLPIEGADSYSRISVRLSHAITSALCHGQHVILK